MTAFSHPSGPAFGAGAQIVVLSEVKGDDGAVLCHAGAVGIIVRAPADPNRLYRVRFPSGVETSIPGSSFILRKEYQRLGVGGPPSLLADHDFHDDIVYRCVVGSRAYGLEGEESDTDRRGIFLPPADLQWSLVGVPEQIENDATQECYWELQKFLSLGLKSNPTILECLYTPIVEYTTPPAEELLEMRDSFLSRLVYQTFNGYVLSQFKKMTRHLQNNGNVRWKHAMHLIRLLLTGVRILREGTVPVRVEQYRERLLSIRRGETPWEEVDRWRLQLHREFDEAYQTTRLPEYPDFERINAFLVKARQSRVKGE